MTLIDVLGQVAAGMRLALFTLGLMMIHSRAEPLPATDGDGYAGAASRARPLNIRAWTMIALAALTVSPFRVAALLDHRPPAVAARSSEIAATGLAIAAFVTVLAARGILRGLSDRRVRRGVFANLAIVAASLGAAWLNR